MNPNRIVGFTVFVIVISIFFAGYASAHLVAVSQSGYHPLSAKRVMYYSNDTSSVGMVFRIIDANTNNPLASYNLSMPLDYYGNQVSCQGGMSCLVGDFSSFNSTGTFYVSIGNDTSSQFSISAGIFNQDIGTLMEFFDATMQQDSDYHADMNSGSDIPLLFMADGSFIMTASQASTTLTRLGSAYRRDPALFQLDNHNISAIGKPDMQEYIVKYVNYLESLQGVVINQRTDGVGIRLNPSVEIINAFVPGPTNMTTLDVYIPGNPPQLLKTVPVVSLCGANDNSSQWQACMDFAAKYYKCQAGEPCLNMSYIQQTGTATHDGTYAVSEGWDYEFGCFFDSNLNNGVFNNRTNPCMIFNPTQSLDYTAESLLGFAEAIPAIKDYDPSMGDNLLQHSINTYQYVKNNTGSFANEDAAYFGASAFLLFDYTNDTRYLQDAYDMHSQVSTVLVSDMTHGNEYYWEEYILHKNALNAFGLTYQVNNHNPEDFYNGKMYFDFKDRGNYSISDNGERVYQFDNNIQFQNSRYILTEGLLASKTRDIIPGSPSFISEISDSELSWITGADAIQQGVALGSNISSMSFIFGIGNFPTQYHSRFLVDTGYSSATNGTIIGVRGTGYQFKDSNNTYVYLDGYANILGNVLGANGNGWHNETQTTIFNATNAFMNGKTYIPGWINGPFVSAYDGDNIFNYNDNRNSYEYTESTNEIVATAIEYLSYMDGYYNNNPRYNNGMIPIVNGTTNSSVNSSNNGNSTNNTIITTCYSNIRNITATCTGGSIISDIYNGGRTIICSNNTSNITIQGWDKPGNNNPAYFEMYKQSSSGNSLSLCVGSSCISNNGYVKSANYPICINTTIINNSTNIQNTTNSTNNTTNNNATNNITTGNITYLSVQNIPSTCQGGTIISDTYNGGRDIICTNNTNSLEVSAWDKPGSYNAQYFEMYKQSSAGSGIQICLLTTCISNNGFAQSQNFPIIVNVTINNTITNNTTTNTTGNATNNATTNNTNITSQNFTANISSAMWYPQGLNDIWVCTSTGGSGMFTYDFYLGDGDKLLNIQQNNVFHTYATHNTYTVNCTVHDQNTSQSMSATTNLTV